MHFSELFREVKSESAKLPTGKFLFGRNFCYVSLAESDWKNVSKCMKLSEDKKIYVYWEYKILELNIF